MSSESAVDIITKFLSAPTLETERDESSGRPSNGCLNKSFIELQEKLISTLVVLQEKMDSPSEETLKKITPFSLGESEEDCLQRIQHIFEITILRIKLIVEFAKRLPGFSTISIEDQFTLLKACSNEVMVLWTARKYDIETDSVVLNNQPYTRENYRCASVGDSTGPIFNFCGNMSSLKVDNVEYALLTAIVIFSIRPCLLEPKKVEMFQEFYIETLRSYVATNRPLDNNYFERLLSTQVDLHILGNMENSTDLCFVVQGQE